MTKKKSIKRKINCIIFDSKGNTYSLGKPSKDASLDEDIIDNHFLSAYDKVGYIDLTELGIRIYFGVDEDSKVWNYNPFLSYLTKEPTYSEVMIFVDLAEIEKDKSLQTYEDFESSVTKFLSDLVDEASEDSDLKEIQGPTKLYCSEKFGFKRFTIWISGTPKELDIEEMDDYFEEHCMNQFETKNVYQEVKDLNHPNEQFNLLVKNGVMYLHSKSGEVDCYFHGIYKDKLLAGGAKIFSKETPN